jgi:hypothetical protein
VRWLLVIAIAVVLVSITILTRTIQADRMEQSIQRVGGWVMLVAAFLAFLFGFSNLDAIRLLLSLIFLMLAPILAALWVWLKLLDQET